MFGLGRGCQTFQLAAQNRNVFQKSGAWSLARRLQLYELGLQSSGPRAEFIEPDGSARAYDLVCKRASLCDLPLTGNGGKTRHESPDPLSKASTMPYYKRSERADRLRHIRIKPCDIRAPPTYAMSWTSVL